MSKIEFRAAIELFVVGIVIISCFGLAHMSVKELEKDLQKKALIQDKMYKSYKDACLKAGGVVLEKNGHLRCAGEFNIVPKVDYNDR